MFITSTRYFPRGPLAEWIDGRVSGLSWRIHLRVYPPHLLLDALLTANVARNLWNTQRGTERFTKYNSSRCDCDLESVMYAYWWIINLYNDWVHSLRAFHMNISSVVNYSCPHSIETVLLFCICWKSPAGKHRENGPSTNFNIYVYQIMLFA